MKKFILLLIVFPFIFTWEALPVNLYVNAGYEGDVETGSFETPFKSIQHAVDAAQEGDEIFIMGGTYREQIEIGIDSITIRNFNNQKVVINGTEPLLEWTYVGSEVYKAVVPWDITENSNSNQVFVDGKMIHLARWPKMNTDNFVTNPTMAIADDAENSSSNSINIKDEAFDEPVNRWKDAKVWINLANGHDGQGWSGKVSYISSSLNIIKASPDSPGFSRVHAAEGHDPWAVQRGSKYCLFNPTATGVYSTGGPEALLARGEWWKNADTLFVRLPNGEKPANGLTGENLVEAKKRLWAFLPKEDQMHHVIIKGLHLFAASITTDRFFTRANLAVNSYNNLIDSINARYLDHFVDQTGHYNSQWKGRTGIILSGVNNVIQNSTIKYAAGAAISVFGQGNKILGNRIYDVNYKVTECGAINSGYSSKCYDPEIAYNLLHNCPHLGIGVGNMYSTNTEEPGRIHIHHNIIQNFMLRSFDGGAINCSAGRNWDLLRADHNLITNGHGSSVVGIYTDYGGQAIFDHNVIWNVSYPMGLNRYTEEQRPPTSTSNGGAMGEIWVYNNTCIADEWHRHGIYNDHKNGSGEGMHYKNNIISNGIKATLELAEELDSNLYIKENDAAALFKNYQNNDFRLKANSVAVDMGIDASPYNDEIANTTPDIGAYEFGAEPWKAGPENVITNIKISADYPNEIHPGDTLYFHAEAYTSVIFKLDPQPEFHWWTNGSGRITDNGKYIADSVDSDAKVFVTTDSLLIEHANFRVQPWPAGIEKMDFDKKRQGNVMVFPNPVNDLLHVKLASSLSKKQITTEIWTVSGRCVKSVSHISSVTGLLKLNVDDVKNGLYILKIRSNAYNGASKFMINR